MLKASRLSHQVWPKRCGHMEGKEVISAEEMSKKIEAILKTYSAATPATGPSSPMTTPAEAAPRRIADGPLQDSAFGPVLEARYRGWRKQ